MSLQDVADGRDELDDLVQGKKGKLGRHRGVQKPKLNKTMIILIFGLIIGILLGHYFIEPLLLQDGNNSLQDCVSSKDLLSKENDCLYSLLDNPREEIEKCSTS